MSSNKSNENLFTTKRTDLNNNKNIFDVKVKTKNQTYFCINLILLEMYKKKPFIKKK